MNKYKVSSITLIENEYATVAEDIDCIVEADGFVITANGDLKFSMKQGGACDAFARGTWKRVIKVEEPTSE